MSQVNTIDPFGGAMPLLPGLAPRPGGGGGGGPINQINPFAAQDNARANAALSMQGQGQQFNQGMQTRQQGFMEGMQTRQQNFTETMAQRQLDSQMEGMTQGGVMGANQLAMQMGEMERNQYIDQAYGRLDARLKTYQRQIQETLDGMFVTDADRRMADLRSYTTRYNDLMEQYTTTQDEIQNMAGMHLLYNRVYKSGDEKTPALSTAMYDEIRKLMGERATQAQNRYQSLAQFVSQWETMLEMDPSGQMVKGLTGDIWSSRAATALLASLGGTPGPNGQVAQDTQAKLANWFSAMEEVRNWSEAMAVGGKSNQVPSDMKAKLVAAQKELKAHLGNETFAQLVHGMTTLSNGLLATTDDAIVKATMAEGGSSPQDRKESAQKALMLRREGAKRLRGMMGMAMGVSDPDAGVPMAEILPSFDPKTGTLSSRTPIDPTQPWNNLVTRALEKVYNANPGEAIRVLEQLPPELQNDFGKLVASRLKQRVTDFSGEIDRGLTSFNVDGSTGPIDMTGLDAKARARLMNQTKNKAKRTTIDAHRLRSEAEVELSAARDAREAARRKQAVSQQYGPLMDQALQAFLDDKANAPKTLLPFGPDDMTRPGVQPRSRWATFRR